MTIAAVNTNLPDVNQKKWKWTGLGTTVAGASIGDWAPAADLAERTVLAAGTFGSTTAGILWQGSINGNTSDAVPFTLHNIITSPLLFLGGTGAFSVLESAEYIRPIVGVASTLSSIDAYLFGRMNPR